MNPFVETRDTPDKPAIIVGEREMSYRDLDRDSRSTALASLRRSASRTARRVAILAPNAPEFFVAAWAAQRSGLYYTPIGRHLKPARSPISSATAARRRCSSTAVSPSAPRGVAGAAAGAQADLHRPRRSNRRQAVDRASSWPALTTTPSSRTSRAATFSTLQARPAGRRASSARSRLRTTRFRHAPRQTAARPVRDGRRHRLLYAGADLSRRAVPLRDDGDAHGRDARARRQIRCCQPRSRPSNVAASPTASGCRRCSCVCCNCPKASAPLSSASAHRKAIHSGAPCTVSVKRAMIDWWGPILHEYYSGTESAGFTHADQRGMAEICRDGRQTLGMQDPYSLRGRPRARTRQDRRRLFRGHGPAFAITMTRPRPARRIAPKAGRRWATSAISTTRAISSSATARTSSSCRAASTSIRERSKRFSKSHPEVLEAAVFGLPDDEFGENVQAVVQLRDARARGGTACGSIAPVRASAPRPLQGAEAHRLRARPAAAAERQDGKAPPSPRLPGPQRARLCAGPKP